MNDTKNILLAWISSLTSIFAAVETRELVTIISAIVLPVMFFTLGKAIDVLLQLYFRSRDKWNADKTDKADLRGSEKKK